MVVEGRQLSLPPNPSPPATSFLFEPTSLSLALHHSDTSFSLYHSLSPLSLSSLPPPPTLLSPPTSSAAFLRLHHHHHREAKSVFVTSSPILGGTAVLLRFYIFNPSSKAFGKLKVVCNHRDLGFDQNRGGVVFGVSHGVLVKLVGGSNVFAMYSASNSKIWLFGLRVVEDFEGVKLIKCAVIDCSLPVFSMNISFGHLILGEENGVRVFQLRQLVKGRVKNERRVSGRRNLNGGLEKDPNSKLEAEKVNNLQRGLIPGVNGINFGVYSGDLSGKNAGSLEDFNVVSTGQFEGKNETHSDSVKLRTVKLRQASKEGGAYFLAFDVKRIRSLTSMEKPGKSAKAISIQALSPNKYIVLDSTGDLHLLHLPTSVHGSDISYNMEHLTQMMKVRKLAVLPGAQTIWISDGKHTVHMLALADSEASIKEDTDEKESKELETQTSVIQVIFSSEKIREIMPLAVDAVLILGQGSLFAYAIS